MKVFISLPMNGYTDEEILDRMEAIAAKFCKKYEDAEFIASFVVNAKSHSPLYYLGKSLSKMASADICVFSEGWGRARGCRIEHECALLYGYRIIYEEEL